MEFITDLLMNNLGYISVFVIGLIIKSPIYQTAKQTLKLVSKALEDDKITKEEVEGIIRLFKKDD